MLTADGWEYDPAPSDALVRPNGTVHAPDIMGIRSHGSGRVSLLAMYYQFLFGGGDKWLFGSQILSAGDGATRPSDTERLILNTLSWLAQPSLTNTSIGIGGYAQDPERLVFPNEQPKVEAQLNETHVWSCCCCCCWLAGVRGSLLPQFVSLPVSQAAMICALRAL